MNWNKYNIQKGDRVILDKGFANSSEVTVIDFTPNYLFATVASDGQNWDTMTNRLTPIDNEIKNQTK